MTDLPIPRIHASDTNYAAGPAVGTATKVDPGSALAASGIVPGAAYAAQHENHERNGLTRAARRDLAVKMLHLRLLDTTTPPADTSAALGVCKSNIDRVVISKGGTDGLFFAGDCSVLEFATGMPNITTDLRRIATTGSRMLAVGDGGTDNAFSVNNGVSWTAGGSTGLISPPTDVVWNGTRFISSTDSGGSVNSTNGVAWAASGVGTDISDILTGGHGNGLAVLTGGIVVAAGIITNPAFAKSSNNGVTWISTGGTVPSPASFVAGRGHLAGNGGSEIYWLGNNGSNGDVELYVSSDGASWTLRGTLPPLTIPSNVTPRLLMCPDTGVLVAVIEQSFSATNFAIMASFDRGTTWTDPAKVALGSTAALGLAGGRLFATIGDKIMASDGIGALLG